MNNSCVSSSVSLRYRGPLSFSFNEYSCCSNGRFDRNPLLYSASFESLTCCACCANSFYSRGPVKSPSYLYGLRQSNLIQWSPYKRLILNGLDLNYDRFPICVIDSSCFCEKDCILKEGRVGGKWGKMGKRRYRRMVSEEKSEWDGFCDGVDRVDEVGVILSLLTEDVGDDCNNVGERRGHSYRKIEVVKKGNNGDNNVRRRKKNVVSGVLESHSEFEYESKIIGSKEGEMRRKEDNRRERKRGDVLRRENVKVRREDERSNSMREVLSKKAREEERLNLSRENQRERFKVEEREDLSTRQDHRQRVRKDGSSASSYYSVTSDDFEIDSEIQHGQEDIEEELAGGYLRDSKKSEGILSHGVKEEMQGYGNYSREQEVVLSKETAQAGFYGASSSVEYDWRKKSEKKLSDVSVEETKSSEELVEKQSRHKEVNQGIYRKTLGSSSRYDDKKQQSASAVNFDDQIREQNDQMIETETRLKSKQSKEMFETHAADVKTYSTTGKLYRDRDEGSLKSQNSVQKSGHHISTGQISSEEEYRRHSGKFAEESKLQEVDIGGTSTAVRQSGIRMKSQEDYSSKTLSTVSNREERRHQSTQATRLLDSRNRYQSTEEVDSERTSILRREADIRMKNHEVDSNSNNKSQHRLRDHSEMTRKHITMLESSNALQETTDVSITPYSSTSLSVVDDGRKRTVVVMEPPSQLAGGSIHVESASVSATEEAADEMIYGAFTASHKHTLDRSQGFHYQSSRDTGRVDSGQPSNMISHEDTLGSADRLQKSSSHYVGEFVQKVRNEISSSEVHEVKKAYETKSVHEDEQHNNSHISSYSSKVSQSKEQNSRSLSHSSGTKGPSDQIWDAAEPSNQEPPEAEATGNESTIGKGDVKRTGKSLWHFLADIFHLQWHSRSETHSSAAKSGGKTSPNQSTSSETWFSGHDPEENVDLNTKSDRISLVEESTSIDSQQEGTISTRTQGELSSSSSSQGDMTQRGAGTLASFSSGGATSSLKESAIPPPSLELRISPVVERISKAGEGEGSSSGTSLRIDQPVPINEKSRLDGKTEELKRGNFGRSDQVEKDRFDEWEEAYRLETEQRRVDEMFMREALLEAKKAADSWEVPVGAVLVRDGKIIARGYNLVEELRDSTAHAEMICIREASKMLRTWRLSETTLYVTLEPCPMCAGAILQARIDTVVWGAPNKLLGADGSWIRLFPNGEGGNGLESTDKPAAPIHPFHPKIVVRRGVLAAECADTMQHFFHLRRRKDKKPEPSTPPSCLPVSHHPSKFLTKMHHIFHVMFCL